MKLFSAAFIFILFLYGCREHAPTNVAVDQSEETLPSFLTEMLESTHGNVPGVAMTIISPYLKQTWSDAAGYDSKEKTDSLTIQQPFRIASVTKTFVAASILRLHEMDSLDIDDSISAHISNEHLGILTDDGYAMDQITIRHCLHHTSGLFDYAVGNPAYGNFSKQDPSKRWTRTEQIQWAVEHGAPVGKPGASYHYSDTGYVLLGEILEKFYDGDLALAIRSLLKFEQLGLDETWLESLEPARSTLDPVHRYFGRVDYTTADPSVDLYGGGGLVSTTMDLAHFFHALFNDQIFSDTKTLELMKSEPSYDRTYNPENNDGHKDYRLGFWKVDIYGHEAYMHTGLWGVVLLHVPDLNSSFAVNYTNSRSLRPLKKAILLIKNLSNKKS